MDRKTADPDVVVRGGLAAGEIETENDEKR